MSLPEGWELKKLGEFTTIKSGKRVPKGYQLLDIKTPYPYIRVTDFKNNGTVNTNNLKYLSEEIYQKIKNYTITDKDIYISVAGTIGKTGIIPNSLNGANLTENAVKIVFDNTKLDKRYLLYFTNSMVFMEQVGLATKMVAMPKLAIKRLKEVIIPLPPLNQQKQISQKLDQALARVERIKMALDGTPATIKRFRQSVLALATSGGLSENAIKWETLTVNDVAEVGTGKTPLKSETSFYENGTVPWLTSSVTGKDFVIDTDSYVTQKAVDECKLRIFDKGTLLVAMYGEGKTRGQTTELTFPATINQACAAIMVDEEKIDKAYLKIRLLENYMETRRLAEGGNQPNLNLSKVRSITVPTPSREEQKAIVKKVETLFALADNLEAKVNQAQKRVDRLTQSILAKAFRGEL